jgi:thiamine-monophosphate kinase
METDFIAALRAIAIDPAARGLLDDAAVLEFGGARLVLTHDIIAEGVHFLPGDPPEDVAWKLVAVNLSDLAAKGATPIGLLAGYALSPDPEWDAGFVRGLGEAVRAFDAPLLGGDTIAMPPGSRRSFGLTAIGRADGPVPSRAGAKAGDGLFVTGTIGDAGAGLRAALGQLHAPALLARYRRPQPRLAAGRALAPIVHAIMDVSDGLLIDAARMAEASGLGVLVELDRVPLSPDYVAGVGDDLAARIDASVAGDDYELLFAGPELAGLSERAGLAVTWLGRFTSEPGLQLQFRGQPVDYPGPLGWEHDPPPI